MRTRSQDTGIPVLLYHSIARPGQEPSDRFQVTAAAFAADLAAVVATGRTPLTATDYAACLHGEKHLPERPVLITFDDGFADYAQVALPILERHSLPATLFVTTGWLGRPGMLSGPDVTRLADGITEIGAHSATHPHLDLLASSGLRTEIAQPREALEQLTGRPVTSFAYPHGSHTARTKATVAESGYRTAHAVKNALSHPGDDPLAVARFTVEAHTPREQVRAVLAGTGAPLAWSGERLRTKGYRIVRRLRSQQVPAPTSGVPSP